MGRLHIVKQGDYLAKIAARYGFSDWRVVYDHPRNAAFRKKRPNPDLLVPGDQIFIPDKERKQWSCATGKLHQFEVKRPATKVRVQIKDQDGQPLALKSYRLLVGEETFERESSQGAFTQKLKQGWVDEKMTDPPSHATLEFILKDAPADKQTMTLQIGHLDPGEEMSGLQARLANLGFFQGEITGLDGPEFQEALRAFQERHGLPVTGTSSPAVLSKLEELHGS